MAPTQTSTQLAVSSEALELSVPVQTLSAVSNGRESEPSAWLAAHAAGRRWSESWMRAIRTSSSMRGRWKPATTQRACALLYRSPWLVSVIRVATRILFSLRSWPLPPPHSAGIGRYVPTSVLTADSDCDFRLVTADSHIWKGYQGRSP